MNVFTRFVFIAVLCSNFSLRAQLSFSMIKDSTGGVDWSRADTNIIAFAHKGGDGYFDVYYKNLLTLSESCITCSNTHLPGKHQGTPSIHPSGNYIAITAEKATHPGSSGEAVPGIGSYSDVWVVRPDGSAAWQITNTPNDSSGGVIYCHFSPDGKKLMWAERTAAADPYNIFNWRQFAGYWVIKVGDFNVVGSNISVTNIKTFGASQQGFYEPYGWSPDMSKIIFSSDFNQLTFFDNQVFTMDTIGANVTQITSGNYNEQSGFTPDGQHIIYMSNENNSNGGCDWWIIDLNTHIKQRLTFFSDTASTQYAGAAQYMSQPFFNTSGTRILCEKERSIISLVSDAFITSWNLLNGIYNYPKEEFTVWVYPNPFSEQTTLYVNKKLLNANIQVINIMGVVVKEMRNVSSPITIQREDLSAGVYFIQLIENGKSIVNKKIIIQ